MSLNLKKINYSELNAKQKENYNFQKISAVLADYGFVTLKLNDDWQGADFIAQHIDGETFLKVQLKGRLTFSKKYIGKKIYIAFYYQDYWYLIPHDETLSKVLTETNLGETKSWEDGVYSFRTLSKQLYGHLEPYKIAGDIKPIDE